MVFWQAFLFIDIPESALPFRSRCAASSWPSPPLSVAPSSNRRPPFTSTASSTNSRRRSRPCPTAQSISTTTKDCKQKTVCHRTFEVVVKKWYLRLCTLMKNWNTNSILGISVFLPILVNFLLPKELSYELIVVYGLHICCFICWKKNIFQFHCCIKTISKCWNVFVFLVAKNIVIFYSWF